MKSKSPLMLSHYVGHGLGKARKIQGIKSQRTTNG